MSEEEEVETEELEKTEEVHCFLCGQDILDEIDQHSQVALIVANMFLLMRFGGIMQIQELTTLYTKDGESIKGWMAKLMAVIPHEDRQQRVLGRTMTLHDIGDIMFTPDYQVFADRSSSREQIVAMMKRRKKEVSKTRKTLIKKQALKLRKKHSGSVLKT